MSWNIKRKKLSKKKEEYIDKISDKVKINFEVNLYIFNLL